jgi:electron transfer flavoprotein beta subunit
MNIVVCIKRVPETAEATLKIDTAEKKLIEDTLSFEINEADNYALEQALILKEQFDGEVVVLSVGPEETDEVIRMCLAKGADRAIRITPEDTDGLDPYAIACLLKEQIQEIAYDIVLTGCMASDDGSAQVGVTLAELLGIQHISLVVGMETKDNKTVIAHRELEGGLQEKYELTLPTLFTVQTGINEPRYASILGIKRAGAKEIKVLANVKTAEFVKTHLQKLSFPPPGKMAEIFEGSTDEVAAKVGEVLKTKGLL